MHVLIPLCGQGERFKSKYTDPKPLIKVAGKEIFAYTLDSILPYTRANSIPVTVIINNRTAFMIPYLSSAYPDVGIINIAAETSGAAVTVGLGIKALGIGPRNDTDILILDADSFYRCNIIEKVCTTIRDTGAITSDGFDGAVVFTNDTDPLPQYSYILYTTSHRIVKIAEKKKISHSANTGAYYFRSATHYINRLKYVMHNDIKSVGEFYISTVIQDMIANRENFRAIEVANNEFVSLGTPALVDAFLQVQEQSKRATAATAATYMFDLDGTLVNTDTIYMKVWKQILAEYHIDVTPEFYNAYIHGNDDKSVHEMLFSASPSLAELRNRKNSLFIEYIADTVPIPGAIEYVTKLATEGNYVCVVTNSNRMIAEAILQHYEIFDKIDHLCIGSECERPKPSPDPYLAAAATATATDRIYIFEDSKSGLLSAVNAKSSCIIGIHNPTTGPTKETLITYGADIVIDSYDAAYLDATLPTIKRTRCTASSNTKDDLVADISRLFKGAPVTITNDHIKGGYINDIIRCRVGDAQYICKLENHAHNSLADMARAIGLYDREYFFYDILSDHVRSSIRLPAYYGTIRSAKTMERRGFVLEDIGNYVLNPDMNTAPIDYVLGIIKVLAKFHADFTGKCTQFKGLYNAAGAPYREYMTRFIQDNIDTFIDRWSFIIDPAIVDIIRGAAADYDTLHVHMSTGTLTLCHGDFKAPNMFWDKATKEPIMIDWQYVIEGKGAQDLVFFIIESLNVERFRELWPILVTYYYEMVRGSINNYSRAEYMADIRKSVLYFPLFVAVWFGVTDSEHLLDKNFPYFFIQKFVNAITCMLDSDADAGTDEK
jgi:HAD superfamily hydrolase (TIGR01509 family)